MSSERPAPERTVAAVECSTTGDPVAMVGLFASAAELLRAIGEIRRRTRNRLEAYTPYPVHGLDRALGLKPSRLGLAVLIMGLVGASGAMGFEWWTSAVDYPLVTGGKPLFSWQAFVPVMFEATVLMAAFTAGLGMLLIANRLPFFGHPLLGSRSIQSVTRDRFALSLEAGEGPFDAKAARGLLEEVGAQAIEPLYTAPSEPWGIPNALRHAATIVLACALAGTATYFAIRLYPTLPPMVHMHDQARLAAFAPSTAWGDGHGMRMPVSGTVPRGHLPRAFTTPEQAGALLVNPLPRTHAVLARGRETYHRNCAVCHGAVGDGAPLLSSAYGAKPANLLGASVDFPDGHIYGVITLGKNAMPSYAAEIDEDDRWAVVHYLRALQRSQNAKDEDLR